MAFRRRRFRRRPVRRVVRRPRFRLRRRLFRRRRPGRVMHFKRTHQQTSLNVTGVTGVSVAYSFALADLPSSSDFTNLFDAFRLNKVVVKILPRVTVVNAGATASPNSLPRAVDVIDYNDDNTGFTTDDLLEYSNHRIHMCDKPWHRKFTPAVEVGLNGAAASLVPGIQKFKQWIDVSAFDAKHYGYKIRIDPPADNTSVYHWDVFHTYYFSCKQYK